MKQRRLFGDACLLALLPIYTWFLFSEPKPSSISRRATPQQIKEHRSTLMRVVRAVQTHGEAAAAVEIDALRNEWPNDFGIRADTLGNVFFAFSDISMAEIGFVYLGSEPQRNTSGKVSYGRAHLGPKVMDGWWIYFIH